MKKINSNSFLLLLFCSCFTNLFAQQNNMDSLLRVLKDASIDSAKAQLLITISYRYCQLGDYPESQKYNDQALSIAERIQDKSLLAAGNFIAGYIFKETRKNSEAIEKFETSLRYYKMTDTSRAKNKNLLGRAYYNLGVVSERLHRNLEAITAYKNSLIKYMEVDNKLEMANCYQGLGNVYYAQDNFQEAINHYEKSKALNSEIQNLKGLSTMISYIGNCYMGMGKYDAALKQQFQGLEIAKKTSDYKSIAGIYNGIGMIHGYKGDYTESLKYFIECQEVYAKNGDKSREAYSYYNIGKTHENLKDYAAAINAYSSALKIYEGLGDNAGASFTLSMFVGPYVPMGNFAEAEKRQVRSLELALQVSDKAQIGTGYSNLAAIYSIWADNDPIRKPILLEKALENYRKSFQENNAVQDLGKEAFLYKNIAGVYRRQGRLEEAEKYYLLALEKSKAIKSYRQIMNSYFELINVNRLLRHFGQAEKYLDTTLQLSLTSKVQLATAYLEWMRLDSAMGNFKQALVHYKLHTALNDSIFNETKSKQIAQMKEQYESEKKDKEIIRLEAEKQQLEKDKQLTTLLIKVKGIHLILSNPKKTK